ncbi:MAG: 5'-nucleotidase [Gammaproteobacteria bacterium]|nr:MAG: 5'-nucleotidase [Gammaproteobacteria bacterium]
MPVELNNCLVIGISSRALFDLREEDRIYERQGLEAYRRYQLENEDRLLKPGAGFALVKAILRLNEWGDTRRAEVVIMSRNSTETSLRIFDAIDHDGLDINRAALSGGAPLAPYLRAFSVDLFLSQYEDDVRTALEGGIGAAILYDHASDDQQDIDQIRIAFDGDATIFSDESEKIYQEQGLDAFVRHESANAKRPLPEGPFARFLKLLSSIQRDAPVGTAPIRTALVTARGRPAHERVIRTLLEWGVVIDEAFFLGGVPKTEFLAAFRPNIFFDDQAIHCERAASAVPTGRVPFPTPVAAGDK